MKIKDVKSSNALRLILLAAGLSLVISCAGQKTFHNYARAGDTIAVAAGMKTSFDVSDITVTINPNNGSPVILSPGDPAIRGSVNFYADPLASMIVSRETNQDLSTYARTYAQTIAANFTNDDKDWYETTVFIDLPPGLPVGQSGITITNSQNDTAHSTVQIIDGVGSPNPLEAENAQQLNKNMIDGLSRVDHYIVEISGAEIPYAIDIVLSHDPDVDNGGSGRALAVNPTGYLKNLHWNDDGSNLKVILMAANDLPTHIKDFKFYVAGGITNLGVSSITGYDQSGNEILGLGASITAAN